MTLEMTNAMALHNRGDQFSLDDPEAPIEVRNTQTGGVEGMSPEALAAEGIAFSHEYMGGQSPGSTASQYSGPGEGLDQNKMTKAQLEEQKMNENQGYPSNLDEAQKVKELEGKVTNIEQGIGTILQHLQNGQSFPENVQPPAAIGGNPVYPDASLTPTPALSGIVKPLSPPSIDSSGSSEPENRPPSPQQVTLSDGRKISVPQTSSRVMALGPATDPAIVDKVEFTVPEGHPVSGKGPEDLGDDWGDESIVETPTVEAPEPTVDPKLEQTQNLVQEVSAFMQANDVHRFWRRHLARNLHRHVGYSGWPKPLQEEFDKRFQGFLNDPQFINTVCRKIISMEFGPALG